MCVLKVVGCLVALIVRVTVWCWCVERTIVVFWAVSHLFCLLVPISGVYVFLKYLIWYPGPIRKSGHAIAV